MICPYLPAMIWVLIAAVAPYRKCHKCGTNIPRLVLSRSDLKCPTCEAAEKCAPSEPSQKSPP
jgi:hypothetical protein